MKQKNLKLKIEKFKIAKLNNLINIKGGGTNTCHGDDQTIVAKDDSSIKCFFTIK